MPSERKPRRRPKPVVLAWWIGVASISAWWIIWVLATVDLGRARALWRCAALPSPPTVPLVVTDADQARKALSDPRSDYIPRTHGSVAVYAPECVRQLWGRWQEEDDGYPSRTDALNEVIFAGRREDPLEGSVVVVLRGHTLCIDTGSFRRGEITFAGDLKVHRYPRLWRLSGTELYSQFKGAPDYGESLILGPGKPDPDNGASILFPFTSPDNPAVKGMARLTLDPERLARWSFVDPATTRGVPTYPR